MYSTGALECLLAAKPGFTHEHARVWLLRVTTDSAIRSDRPVPDGDPTAGGRRKSLSLGEFRKNPADPGLAAYIFLSNCPCRADEAEQPSPAQYATTNRRGHTPDLT